jgi:hypothetical protein
MIWYKTILTKNEIQTGLGKELKSDFQYLFHQLNDPDGMAIYNSGHVGNQYIFYYLSLPKIFKYNLGKIFKKYRLTTVTEPLGMIFQLIFKNLNRVEFVS